MIKYQSDPIYKKKLKEFQNSSTCHIYFETWFLLNLSSYLKECNTPGLKKYRCDSRIIPYFRKDEPFTSPLDSFYKSNIFLLRIPTIMLLGRFNVSSSVTLSPLRLYIKPIY